MDYEFGDIIDARKHRPIGHFFLVLGETDKHKVMYYRIFSRVYTVFPDILDFFNDCIAKNYKRFFNFFSKEKNKEKLVSIGNLSDTFFLDKYNNYNLCLEVDSMIVIKKDPDLEDKEVLDRLYKGKKIIHKNRLSKGDMFKLNIFLKHSINVSPYIMNNVGKNFNKWLKGRT